MRPLAAAALFVAALSLTGCGAKEGGNATLWVTRDRGGQVLLVRSVPAGLTAMQALDRVAEIKTSYGGRYVQSLEGVSGSATSQRDWFYFVNGVEADRGAAEYRLHPGDVEWWDYRAWMREPHVPVVVGAFPEPFLHGYAGKHRSTAVRYRPSVARRSAERIGRLVGAISVGPAGRPVAAGSNTFEIVPGRRIFRAWGEARGPWHFEIGAGGARRLAANPGLARFRFRGLP